MLNKKKYQLKKILGEGGYESVYLCYDNIDPRNVAINYYGYFYDNENSQTNIVMEYANDGNLNEMIEWRTEKFKEDEILEYFTQICEGLTAIHQAKIIHRDLNPCIIINFWKLL